MILLKFQYQGFLTFSALRNTLRQFSEVFEIGARHNGYSLVQTVAVKICLVSKFMNILN